MKPNEIKQSELTHEDCLDIEIFLVGLNRWADQHDKEGGILYQSRDLPGRAPADIEAFTSVRHLELVDKLLHSFDEPLSLDEESFKPEILERIREKFLKAGVEHFLEDGKITKEELLVAASERGKAEMRKNPEQYAPGEEAVQAASRLLVKHGIDDPDGSIAQGYAVHSELFVQKANEGLGITSTSVFSPPSPVVSTAPSL